MFSLRKYTLNFDGSHNNQDNKAGAGCIIRDDKGNLIVAASYNITKIDLPYYNVAIAEAIGLKNGLILAQNNYLNLNFIKGDNKEVIDLVLGVARPRRQCEPALDGIIAEIKVLIRQGFADIELISRDANKVADKFASIGSLLNTSSKVYNKYNFFEIPSQVVQLIEQEKASNITNERNDNGEGSGLASNIGMAGAAVAGVAMLAWGVSKLFSGESSSSNIGVAGAAVAGVMLAWGVSKLFVAGVAMLAWGVSKLFVAGVAMLAWGVSKLSSGESSSSSKTTSNTYNAHNSPKSHPGLFTLQYFGSDRNQLPKARAGCIITNREEFFVAGAYNLDHQYPDCNIAIAEAIALWNGLKLAKDNNIRLNIIQGRNVEVRDRVLDREKRPPKSLDLITFIRQIKSALCDQEIDGDETLQLIEEESIKVARALATVGGTLKQEAMIYRSTHALPERVANLLNDSLH